MKNILLLCVLICALLTIVFLQKTTFAPNPNYDADAIPAQMLLNEQSQQSFWHRPPGPLHVGLQVGHLQKEQLPEELKKLRTDGGAYWQDYTEAQICLIIAKDAANMLQKQGIKVDILPATIPPHYQADAFVAIHADFDPQEERSGFKLASPPHDLTGKAKTLEQDITKSYKQTTNMPIATDITRNMTYYYAFSWWRFVHAIAPTTPGIILETGFMTSENDREIIIDNPNLAATGIAKGIETFLK